MAVEGLALFRTLVEGRDETAAARIDEASLRKDVVITRAGGYRFASFDRPPGHGDLLLRHDVDL